MKRKQFKIAENQDGTMSLPNHLRELRNRILVCIIVMVCVMMAGLHYAKPIVEILLKMGEQCGYQFVYLAPQELLMQYFSVALLVGICGSLPVLLYEIWAFIRPGLKKSESLFFLLAMIFGLLFFGIGVYFAYRIMLPFMLYFLSSLSEGSGILASISVQNYLSFLGMIFIIFGVVFELPVTSVLLTQMGIIKSAWMRKGRRAVIVIIFVVAALITPPDIVSQIMVAIPIMLLYEFSIGLSSGCERLKIRKNQL